MRRVGLVLLAAIAMAASMATSARAGAPETTTLTLDPTVTAGSVNHDLGGFNRRDGVEAVGPLDPSLIRLWSVDFSKITDAPGSFDWSVSDAEIDQIWAMGAAPLIVFVGRPPWAPDAGSAGYEQAVTEAMQRYGVERRPAVSPPAWFESGNEPEFPPTSHGQLVHDVPLDAAAQARAVHAVEEAGGEVVWGGPGALFADFVTIESFAAAGAAVGRTPDYLSWHTYTNQPLLGPDGAEFDDPASAAAYEVAKGTNPLATPRIIGISADLVELMAAPFTAPDGEPPDAVLTEWHLSSGGLDLRHDTAEGAAHTVGGLIELQAAGAGAATFFSSVDRHCDQPSDAPDPMCGDWGTASADGVRKPVWWAFDWWRQFDGDVIGLGGAAPEDGLWAVAARNDDTIGVLVASFSVADPIDRHIELAPGAGIGAAKLWRLAESGPQPPTVEPLDPGAIAFDLPANRTVFIELTLAPPTGEVAPPARATQSVVADVPEQLPATGPKGGGLAGLALALALLAWATRLAGKLR